MKRLVSILLMLLIGCSFLAVGSCSSAEGAGRAVSQADFLADMAKGIQERNAALGGDTSNMIEEEDAAYYNGLVDCELNNIGKYQNATFEDERFGALAHQYILGCQTQKEALNYWRLPELYNALWSGGLSIRAGIIRYFYENYGLDITAEEAAGYLLDTSDTSTSVSVSVSGLEELEELYGMFRDDNDVVLKPGDLTVVKATGEMKKFSFRKTDTQYFKSKFVVQNNSKHSLSRVSVNYVILDKDENLLGSDYASFSGNVAPGKTVVSEATINLEKYPGAKYLRLDFFKYDGNDNNMTYPLVGAPENIQDSVIEIK